MSARVRAALRFLAWLVAALAALLVVGGAIRSARLGTLAGYALFDVALLVVSYGAWRALEKRRPGATPLAIDRRAAGALVRGAAAGALLVALVVGALALAGSYDLAPRACRAVPLVRFAGWTSAFVVLASVFEETLFRGYGLFVLRDAIGPAAAAAVTGLLFALGHQANPGFGAWAVVNLAVVGVVLGLWVLREGSVWVAVGAHAGWNGAIVAGAAVPVSGVTLPAPCHSGVLVGPEWLTGGSFGIEAGVPTLAAWLGFGWWLRRGGSALAA